MFVFGKSSQTKMIGLEYDVVTLCNKALEISKVDFGIIDGLRTANQQQEIYNNGQSELDGFVNKSAHQSGLAVDILPYVKGINCFDYSLDESKLAWLEVGRAMLRAGRLLGFNVEWGITYDIGNEKDYPHFQINR